MINQIIFPSIDNQICLIDLGEETNAATKFFTPKPKFHYVIHFVVEGKGYFTSSETEGSHIGAGDAFAIYENDTVYYESEHNNPMHYFWIGFNGKDSENILAYIGFSKNHPVSSFDNQELIVEAFQNLFTSWKAQDRFLFLSKFYQLVVLLHENNNFRQNNISDDEDVLSRAINYMNLNLEQNFKINHLVEDLCIDRSYFSKIFKKKYNITPYQYFIRLKLQKAEYMIKNTNFNITQISDMLGFTDHYTFSKTFKRYYGVSPLGVRKKYADVKPSNNKK